MILAAGLSPAWQQILRFSSFHRGAVNRALDAHWCASGKVINVAVAAAALGEQTVMISAIGGLTGDAIQREIERLGIQAEWIHTLEPTRVCTTILEEQGPTTELVENIADVTSAVLEDFVDRFRIYASVADVTVLSGSLPGNAPPEFCARLIRSLPARFLLDVRGAALQHALPHAPFLVKPNREELQATLGRPLTEEHQLITGMRELNRWGAQWVVVSDGPRGVWVTAEETAVRLIPPQVDVVNPIGCGDCLAAGIASELVRHDDVVEAVRFGMGAAADNAQSLLPARLDRERCEQLADEVRIEQVPV